MRISTQHYACGFCCCCFLVWTVWGASSPSFSTSALATATSLASKRPLKRLLLNELDSKAKPWWYGWTCKSIFHIISRWLVEHGDRMTRCGQCCQWFAREVKEVLLELSGCILHLYNRDCSGNEKPCYQHRAFSVSVLNPHSVTLLCGISAHSLQEDELEVVDHSEMTSVFCLSTHTCHNCLQSHCRKKGSV